MSAESYYKEKIAYEVRWGSFVGLKYFMGAAMAFSPMIAEATTCSSVVAAANDYIGKWLAIESDPPLYDGASNTTTFSYTVSGSCNDPSRCSGNTKTGKNLSHWVIALDDGMVVNDASASCLTSTTWSVGSDPTTGLYGLKFDDGQPLGTACTYTFLLEGRWASEFGQYSAKAGSNQLSDSVANGCTLAPSEPIVVSTYKISGETFLDINANGIPEAGEPRVPGISISLDGTSLTTTDSTGAYVFSGLRSGSYRVEANLPMDLEQYLIASSPGSELVSIGPDAVQNFAYSIDFQAILEDLDSTDPDADGAILRGQGKTIGFWKHQLNVMLTGKGKAQVAGDQMLQLISSVNGYFLAIPFAPLNVSSASSILTYHGPDAKSLLLKQLLASEYNKFYGLGLENSTLNNLILSAAESYASSSQAFTREQLLIIKDTLDVMNNLGH